MHHDERLLQRLIDGDLSRHEADAMERAALDRPELAQRLRLLRQLHADLAGAARPLGADQHHDLHTRIVQHLPTTRPKPYARIRPIDLVTAATALALVLIAYALFGSIVRGSFAVLTLACISFVGGSLVLVLAGMLRRMEAGLISRLLGRPIAVGPADLLICRAVGVGLAIGGLYLTRLF
jgi:hypothetical protein